MCLETCLNMLKITVNTCLETFQDIMETSSRMLFTCCLEQLQPSDKVKLVCIVYVHIYFRVIQKNLNVEEDLFS